MIQTKDNGSYHEVTKVFAGGTVQQEIIKIWSNDADNWVYEATDETSGALPLTFHADGSALVDYQVYGAAGGVGDETPNLWDESYPGFAVTYVVHYEPIYVGSGEFTLSTDMPFESSLTFADLFFLSGNVSSGASTAENSVYKEQSQTVQAIDGYVTIGYRRYNSSYPDVRNYHTMLNEGSTALPYEPYGYKLDMVSTATIYIGNEPLCGIGTYTDSLDLSTGILTRRIKKLVLDGTEQWYASSSVGVYYTTKSNSLNSIYSLSICNRFAYHFVNSAADLAHGEYLIDMINEYTWLRNNDIASVGNWKNWLAQQYAAGTPVTVWYVLAEPEVSTITVPSGLTGIIEGYLIQDGTPTPETPIYPTANGVKQADDTYSINVDATTTPIYIGNDPLWAINTYADCADYQKQKVVRAIKKYVLTGDENWEEISGAYASRTYFRWVFAPINYCVRHVCTSSHFEQASITTATTTVGFDVFDSTSVNGEVLAIRPDNVQTTTLADFKAWLAAQYAAGTPMTVWCALTTAEEEDPSVPLPEIPTVDGTTMIDYNGTPKPNEMYIKYKKGW